MIRASLWAVAVMAFAGPKRAFRRRKKAPRALRLSFKLWAAIRNTSAARLVTARVLFFRICPPLMRWSGHRPSQEPKCFSLGQRCMLSPISEISACTLSTSRPSTSVRSTPVTRYSCSRRLKGSGLCLDLLFCFFFRAGKGLWARSTFASQPDKTVSTCWSHSAICSCRNR